MIDDWFGSVVVLLPSRNNTRPGRIFLLMSRFNARKPVRILFHTWKQVFFYDTWKHGIFNTRHSLCNVVNVLCVHAYIA